ncbi:hypothetical protein SDC9_72650 [bioreactor metagenome]|uniref:Uncharacterized protein n=1 Tax=bioreactor metagenome TaxID=1076179 RepID=A0A644YCY3_9ZZZZ
MVGHDFLHQRQFWRHDRIGRAIQGIRSSREDRKFLIRIFDFENNVRTFRTSDPVPLHLLDALRPIHQFQIIQQAFCISSDFQHPLSHRFTVDRMTAAFADAVDNFFVGKNGTQCRTPVDGNFRLIGQTLFIQFCEDPLRPFVVAWIRCIDFAAPIITESKRLDLALEGFDVVLSKISRIVTGIQRILLSRQAESIPTHRMQYVKSLCAFCAGNDIRRRVAFRVAYMQALAGWVREHIQYIIFRLPALFGRFEGTVVCPIFLPFFLDRFMRITHFQQHPFLFIHPNRRWP